MVPGTKNQIVEICVVICGFLLTANLTIGQTVTVDAAPSHAANTFSPVRSLGAAIDRLRTGTPDHLLTDPVLKEILGAGWQTVTYRQNTELMVEAWHWNPHGTWSDAEKTAGLLRGNAEPTTDMIRHSWASPLPHRGFSRGDGNGWSRLTDGDPKSYWKSNPYLTKTFTGEDDSLHPQWVMIDLGSKIPVNAIRIAWAEPYAKHYSVQFWTGELEPFYEGTTKGTWQTFPLGATTEGKGGTVTLKLVSWMIPVRYLRIWMTESSNTCDSHGSADKRNCVGYAINELYVGALSADGQFNDYVTHFPSRQSNRDLAFFGRPMACGLRHGRIARDQVGFDFFFTCGVTADFPRWFRLRCCIPHPRMRRMRSPISTNATIPSPGSRWEKKPTGSTCCPKTTVRCTCNSPLRFTGSFPRPSWAVRPSKERLRMLKCGRTQPGKSHGSEGSSTTSKPAAV